MVKLLVILVVCFSLSHFIMGQEIKPFTAQTEFQKQHKKFPEISVFNPEVSGVDSLMNVVYRVVNDLPLHIDIYKPKQTKEKSPLLIMVHGGGWNAGDKSLEHPIARYMAGAGIVAVAVQYRKSPEALYPAAIQDVRCAIRYLRYKSEDYNIDTTRVVIMGESAGGQIAALIGATNVENDEFATDEYMGYSSRVNKVVDVDGVLCFIHPDSREGVDKPGKLSCATQWFGRPAHECPELWDSASPLYRVGRESADFLFINSSQPRFSAGQSQMIERLRFYGHEAKEIKTTETPHTFWLFNPWAKQVADWVVNEILDGSQIQRRK